MFLLTQALTHLQSSAYRVRALCLQALLSWNDHSRMKSIVALLATLLLSPLLSAQDEKALTVGYVENICVTEVDFVVKAKLDTGATTSSIHASIIEQSPPDAKRKDRYVVFSIKTENGLSPPIRKPDFSLGQNQKERGRIHPASHRKNGILHRRQNGRRRGQPL